MTEKFCKNLALNKKVVLSNIGSFSIEQQPAEMDFVNKTLHAPLPVLHFNADKNIAAENAETIELSNEIKSTCAINGTFFLPEIGTIKKEINNFSFESELSVKEYFPDIIIERIIRKDAQHTIRVGEDERTNREMQEFYAEEKIAKDKWWAYAIVLALLGIIALIIYNLLR